MHRHIRRILILCLSLVVILPGTSLLALFTNGGFEAADFSSWEKSTFLNYGLSGSAPFTSASIVRTAGGADQTVIVGGPGVQPLSLSDSMAGSGVRFPRFGSYAARVNQPGTSRNGNAIKQTAVVGPGDVDDYDELVHLRFAYLPVVQDGGHPANEQAFFNVRLYNVTKGVTVYERFVYANEPGVPWQSGGGYLYTGWQVVDIAPGPEALDVGDEVEIEVVAAGCSQSGHGAWVYLDAFGSQIPGLTIVGSASGPAIPGSTLEYHFHLVNGGDATLNNASASITLPAQTTFASVSNPDCGHAGGVVTCTLGNVAPDATIDFDLVVNVAPGATGTIALGDYSVSGDSYPALLGPLVNVTVDTAPVGVADGYSVAEDGTLAVPPPGVLANDTDANGDGLTAELVSGPAHGSLTLNADGSFSYTPEPDYAGPDSFTYRPRDANHGGSPATVTLNVTNTPDAPVGASDAFSVAEDGSLAVPAPGVLGNDTDADGDSLTAALVDAPAHGTLLLNANGSFTYTPEANYAGADSFSYRATDGVLFTAVTTVTLTVTPENDAPVGNPDTYTVAEDAPLSISAPGVLANDTDVDADALSAVLVSGPAHGTLTLHPDGSFIYTPAADYAGTDSFTYRATDGTVLSDPTTVSLTVTPEDDAPAGQPDAYTATEDTVLSVPAPGVLGNDTDADGNALMAELVSGPSHGTITLDADGSFTYTPAADYAGTDSFTYRATDGTLFSAPATVTLTVTQVNDAPIAQPDSYAGTEDVTLTVAAPGVLGNDSDVDGQPLTVSLVSGPAHGTLTLNANGSFSYVPEHDYNGIDSFTYVASDGTATSTPVTVTLILAAVDDITWYPRAGRASGGVKVTIANVVFGTPGTPVTVTVGGLPGLDAQLVDATTLTFVTPALPVQGPVDITFTVAGWGTQTLASAFTPMPDPAPADHENLPANPGDSDNDGLPDEWELRYGLDPTNADDAGVDADGDGYTTAQEFAAGTHPTGTYVRYFAEGLNSPNARTEIAVANASAVANQVRLTYFRQGAAPVVEEITLAGHTRRTLDTALVAGLEHAAFGIAIEANETVVAERTMSWNYGGESAHTERAVEASTTWHFAEGATTGRFTLFFLLTNPNDVTVKATVRYLPQASAPLEQTYTLPPFARVTVPVNLAVPGLDDADVGATVTASRPIVAERSMYLDTPSTIWMAGTSGTGVPRPETRWYFAEGASGTFFDTWLLLSNPGTTDATVDVRYVADSGADVTRTHTVPAGRRITIRVADESPDLRDTSFGTTVTSTNGVPLVAERAMWWPSDGNGWLEGHVGSGIATPGRMWGLAEGVAAADGSSETFALVSNTTPQAGTLKVTALFGDGTAPVEKTVSIKPNGRLTIRARDLLPEVVGRRFSLIVESVGSSPVDIVVDHSIYWNSNGMLWGSGTTAPGTRIQ